MTKQLFFLVMSIWLTLVACALQEDVVQVVPEITPTKAFMLTETAGTNKPLAATQVAPIHTNEEVTIATDKAVSHTLPVPFTVTSTSLPITASTPTLTGVVDARDPTPSLTPVLPFPGVVYLTDEGLWRTSISRQSELLFDQVGVLEPNGHRLIYSKDQDIWLADLDTDIQQNLTNTPDMRECCSQWWPSQPGLFLVMQYDPVREFELGQMVAVTSEGSYQVLVEGYTETLPAISPNGKTIAFEVNGSPAFYHEHSNIEWLTLQPPEISKVNRIGSPVWSTDGQMLAWTAYSNDIEGRTMISLLIYHVGTSDIDVKHLYYPGGHDSWGPKAVWSPDDMYVTFYAIDQVYSERGLWILSTAGVAEWNLGEVHDPVWSFDSRFLIYHTDEGVYFTSPPDFTDKIRMALPPDAVVTDWQNLP